MSEKNNLAKELKEKLFAEKKHGLFRMSDEELI